MSNLIKELKVNRQGLIVRKEGCNRVSKLFLTQRKRMDYAGNIAKNGNISIVVHKQDRGFKNGYEMHIKVKKSPRVGLDKVLDRSFDINYTKQIIQTLASV